MGTSIPASGGASGYAPPSWYDKQALFLASKVSALTEFAVNKAGVSQVGAPTSLVAGNCINANYEGGGLTPPNTTNVALSTATVWQNPSVNPFGIVWRVRFTDVSSSSQQVGIFSTDGSKFLEMALTTAQDATHWCLLGAGSSSAAKILTLSTADKLWHDIAFTFDGTTCAVWNDTVSLGTTTDTAHIPNVPCWPVVGNVVTPNMTWTKAIWGYAPL